MYTQFEKVDKKNEIIHCYTKDDHAYSWDDVSNKAKKIVELKRCGKNKQIENYSTRINGDDSVMENSEGYPLFNYFQIHIKYK